MQWEVHVGPAERRVEKSWQLGHVEGGHDVTVGVDRSGRSVTRGDQLARVDDGHPIVPDQQIVDALDGGTCQRAAGEGPGEADVDAQALGHQADGGDAGDLGLEAIAVHGDLPSRPGGSWPTTQCGDRRPVLASGRPPICRGLWWGKPLMGKERGILEAWGAEILASSRPGSGRSYWRLPMARTHGSSPGGSSSVPARSSITCRLRTASSAYRTGPRSWPCCARAHWKRRRLPATR